VNVDGWSALLAQGIATAILRYQQIRPHEDPSLLYARILKVLYTTFRDQINPMSDETAKKVLTHLLNTSASMRSQTFVAAFQITAQLLMINWGLDQANPALLGIAGIPGGANKQFMICLLHGIDARYDAPNWTFFRNGMQLTENEMLAYTRQANHDRLNREILAQICQSFDASLENFIDIRYLVHRMQKPVFEVPNPVILESFLRDSDQALPAGPDGEVIRDRNKVHSFYKQFLDYFAEEAGTTFAPHATIMHQLIKAMFVMYDRNALHLWSVSSAAPAATYMQNNATELPSFAYHGNLGLDKINKSREDVRCVGHLGNSFPGCSTIRQGKGMLNMYERAAMPIHVM